MNDNLKLAVKIGGKTALTWIFTFGFGLLVTFITLLIALYTNIELAGTDPAKLKALFFWITFFKFSYISINFWSTYFSNRIFHNCE
jgi:hypothetical protein